MDHSSIAMQPVKDPTSVTSDQVKMNDFTGPMLMISSQQANLPELRVNDGITFMAKAVVKSVNVRREPGGQVTTVELELIELGFDDSEEQSTTNDKRPMAKAFDRAKSDLKGTENIIGEEN